VRPPTLTLIAATILTFVATGLPSCKASFNAKLAADAKPVDDDPFGDVHEVAKLPGPTGQTEFIGVARRLTLAPDERNPNCQCLTAVLGFGSEPDFDWHNDKPYIGPDALVVAISTAMGSDGTSCATKGRGPSIAAIDQDGQDVIVVLEEFNDTRPIVLGAIIPNPGQGGAVYLRPPKNTPFGHPLPEQPSGQRANQRHRNLCKIGDGHPFD